MIEDLDQLVTEANQASGENRWLEAAFLYERAREREGDPLRAAELAMDAAYAWYHANKSYRALALVLEILRGPPAAVNAWVRYEADRLRYYVVLDDPRPDRLESLLEEACRSADALYDGASSDSAALRGGLARVMGDWRTALEHFEVAWSRGDRGRIHRAWHAEVAAESCLLLGRQRDARRWVTRIEEVADRHWIQCAAAEMWLHIEVAENQAQTARSALLRVDELIANEQAPWARLRIEVMGVRALLLDPGNGDPGDPSHLARHRLEQSRSFDTTRYGELLVAYRRLNAEATVELAALRHAAGVPPVDDLYYLRPQTVPAPSTPPPGLADRVRRARAAAVAAVEAGTVADEPLRCTWRTDLAQELLRRTDELAAVFGL
ncbi:hypothetical protein [Nonomuraea sediminis]|uniref:hypothetical protein n=1 Tax=Nonomuraea sediminis TaxID=2835864 RepID=UPI001BDBB51E|nr:hypothetical protein [Nonomuraea sediminis]